jgi:glutamate 5-kinase
MPMEVGRALVNYSATEIVRIKGLRSTQIQSVLGYADSEYVALRRTSVYPKGKKGVGLLLLAWGQAWRMAW